MAKGNDIIVSPSPKGVFLEGNIRTASKPGIVVQLDVSEGLDDTGRPDFEPYDAAADGNQRPIIVLLPDVNRGKLATDAYVAGERCFCYCPIMGEELNMLIGDVAGTGDSHSFGEILMVDDGTGELVATTGSPEAEPFQLLEALAALTADALGHCMFTGY